MKGRPAQRKHMIFTGPRYRQDHDRAGGGQYPGPTEALPNPNSSDDSAGPDRRYGRNGGPLGGVLFIDEAYALVGKTAAPIRSDQSADALLARMENWLRGCRLVVIIATLRHG